MYFELHNHRIIHYKYKTLNGVQIVDEELKPVAVNCIQYKNVETSK